MFKEPLDIQRFFETGYFVTELPESEADRLLEDIRKEIWIEVAPDVEDYSNLIEKDYKNRYIAAHSMLRPNDLRESYKRYQREFNEWAFPIIKHYKTANRILLSALMGVKGYFMDMHSDVGDRCPFTVLLYLGEDLREHQDQGGNLNIFDVTADNPHENPRLIEKIVPSHGKMVILNNLDPTIYHSVDEIKTDIRRYSILSSFGIDFVPDWQYEFKTDRNMSGQVLNPGVPISIDGHLDALNMLNGK